MCIRDRDIDEHLLELHGVTYIVIIQNRVHNALIFHPLDISLEMCIRDRHWTAPL